MVHHILDVAQEQLEEHGARSLNTNKIAEAAGISTGSLYQYFANKDMIVGGIIERAVLDSHHIVRSTMMDGVNLPPKLIMGGAMRLMLERLAPYRIIVKEIFITQPMLADTSLPAVMESFLLDMIRDYLVLNQDKYRLKGGLAAMYVSVNSAMYMFLRWIVDPPIGVSENEFITALIDQVSTPIIEV